MVKRLFVITLLCFHGLSLYNLQELNYRPAGGNEISKVNLSSSAFSLLLEQYLKKKDFIVWKIRNCSENTLLDHTCSIIIIIIDEYRIKKN